MNLMRIFGQKATSAAKFSAGRVGYAIGDVHGRADLLASLIGHLEEQAEAETRDGAPPVVIFLGDYVDRGPNSMQVIETLLAGSPAGYERHFLKGNHEQSMLAFLEDPMANRAWVYHGGSETLVSYGVQPPPSIGATDEDWQTVAQNLKAKLPATHLEFLSSLQRYLVMDDYLFVHAGVEVSKTLEEQSDQDLYWSRSRWLNNKHRFSHKVVHGHTPTDEPYIDDRRIGVDTGAYASGTLTAARFEAEQVSFVAVSANTNRRPAPKAKPRRFKF